MASHLAKELGLSPSVLAQNLASEQAMRTNEQLLSPQGNTFATASTASSIPSVPYSPSQSSNSASTISNASISFSPEITTSPQTFAQPSFGISNAQSNTSSALSTPGMAGLSPSQFAGQNNVGNTGQMYPLTTTQGTSQYTNTNQASSNNQPFFLFNPAFYESIPSEVASTAGNLANWLTMPLGYTPGTAPTAGGQFPNNYPYSQSDINNLAITNPALAKAIQNQYSKLSYLQGHALPETMTNAGYEYLGTPSTSGDVLNYITSPLNEAKMGLEEGGLLGGGILVAGAPVAAATSSLLGAGIGSTLNPAITYLLSGGQATPQQLAQSSAQGIVYGGAAGALMPGINSGIEGIIGNSLAARMASSGLTNLAFTNAYNAVANDQPAPLSRILKIIKKLCLWCACWGV